MPRGRLIALEGIDGSGTTTQAERLAHHLQTAGRAIHLTAEPSGGPVGLVIRSVLNGQLAMSDRVLAMLFAADRLDHIEREIEPALAEGRVVVTDRYLISSLAYQAVGNPVDWIVELNAKALRPDVSILLRASAETAASRRLQRGGEPERFDALDKQRKIAQAYEAAFARDDVGPVAVIDAEQSFKDVAVELRSRVDGLLGRHA